MKKQRSMPKMEISYSTSNVKKVTIKDSKSAYKCLLPLFNQNTIEYSESFYAIFLNRINNTIGWSEMSKGGISSTVIDCRELLSLALLSGSSGIILAHNHPSGNLQPSESDIALTHKLTLTAQLLDIKILDHLIISKQSYYSFADNGKI